MRARRDINIIIRALARCHGAGNGEIFKNSYVSSLIMSTYRAVAPVRNFNLLCEELVFPNFSVRHFPEEELSDLVDRDGGFWSDADFDFCKHDPWFFMEYEADPKQAWNIAAIELEHFLNALTLYKTSSTILRMGHFYVKKLEGSGVDSQFRGGLVPRRIPVYVLEKDFCEDFLDFYNKYKEFLEIKEEHRQRKRISFATNFFSRVRRNSDLTERLIFLSVSLEALYSREINELKYRYSHRAAILLGNDSNSRTRIFNLVKAFYNQRSKVLHGNLKFRITSEEISAYNEVIRVSILRYISVHLKGRGEVITDLDELIFNEKGRAKLLADAGDYFNKISEYREN